MKLYTYEHCPFCVRAKMILNLTNTKFEEVILLNDDEATPISLCGNKQVPILEYDGKIMVESLDIVDFINKKHNFLSPVLNDNIEKWVANARSYLIKLTFPRLLKLDLPEFKTQGAIDYFKKKKEASMQMTFEEALLKSDEFKKQAEEHLEELSSFIPNGKDISKDDIILFPILRLLSCVDGLKWNEKVLKYVEHISKISNIPLYKKV